MLALLAATSVACLSPVAVDGDTLRCEGGLSVRIWGIQAPELGEPGAVAATASLQRLSNGGVVCDPKGESYRRLVGQCYNRQLFDLGFFQVMEGHAQEWCRYSRNFYRTC